MNYQFGFLKLVDGFRTLTTVAFGLVKPSLWLAFDLKKKKLRLGLNLVLKTLFTAGFFEKLKFTRHLINYMFDFFYE